MNRYIISIHAGLEGVRLSLVGSWGNIPFADLDEAETFAKEDAGGARHSIEREVYRKPRPIGALNYD